MHTRSYLSSSAQLCCPPVFHVHAGCSPAHKTHAHPIYNSHASRLPRAWGHATAQGCHGRRRTAVAAARPAWEDLDAKPAKRLPIKEAQDIKEAHKVFDEAIISVKAGDGGRGEVVESGRGKWVPNHKYRPGKSLPKKLWLPASEPADGADGADVVLVCDPSLDTLLHLHQRKQYAGRKGSSGSPSIGSSGPKRSRAKKAATPALEIPVPPGTVVKRKGTGALLGELINPGDRLVVARGGLGGQGTMAPSRDQNKQRTDRRWRRAQASGAEVVEVVDDQWRVDAKGSPGQELTLHLLLRVVADVGIVGLPNAGKSSLLRALTRATPDIAPYPFTTLMPNLGVMASGGGSGGGDAEQGLMQDRRSKAPVLADLPGLIEGAHTGRGLGRMFLRHLRRTRAMLHVVDAATEDPGTDYLVVREELRMYNPEYCSRPHVVVLNKMDIQDAAARRHESAQGVLAAARQHCAEWVQEEAAPQPPVAVVAVSAVTGLGMPALHRVLQQLTQQQSAAAGPAAGLRQQHKPQVVMPDDSEFESSSAVAGDSDQGEAGQHHTPSRSAAAEAAGRGDGDGIAGLREGEAEKGQEMEGTLSQARQGGEEHGDVDDSDDEGADGFDEDEGEFDEFDEGADEFDEFDEGADEFDEFGEGEEEQEEQGSGVWSLIEGSDRSSSGSSGNGSAGSRSDDDDGDVGEVEPEDAWLMRLSEEELIALADRYEDGRAA